MVEFINVNKTIKEKKILNNINLKLPNVGFVIIKGINGSGKSTLLNLIGGLDKPTSGDLKFNNLNISKMNEQDLENYREEYISFVFQDSNLFENMNVLDNMNIVGNNDNIDKIMDFLALRELANKKIKKLSGGEKQRVAIARAINKNTGILLCDEPTSSLDYNTKEEIFKYLKYLSQSKLVVVVSHDDNLLYNYADIIIELYDGTIVKIDEKKSNNTINNEIFQYENRFNKFKFLLNNFFTNKKKLMFSGALLTVTSLLILLSSSLSSLDYIDIHRSAVSNENDNIIVFNKNKKSETDDRYSRDSVLGDNDIKYLKENKISNSKLIIGRGINVDGGAINFGIKYNTNNTIPYYHKFLMYFSFLSVADLKNEIYGRTPNSNNEIVISSYLADTMIEYGVMDKDKNYYYPESYEKLLNDKKELILGSNNVIISGIYKMNLDKFEDLKKSYDSLPKDIENSKDLFYEVIDNIAGNIYVKEDFFDLYKNIVPVIKSETSFAFEERNADGTVDILSSKAMVFTDEVVLKDNSILTNLEQNEIIINQEIIEMLKLNENNCVGNKITIYIYTFNPGSLDYSKKITLTIKGISLNNDYYLNQEDVKEFIDKKIYINKAFIYENDNKILKNIFNKFPLENANYTIMTNYSQKIIGLTGFVDFSSKIFIVVNIIFAILGISLIVNYFLNSIEIHKKDIAILKALGIKNKDIQSLFKNELLIIMLSSYIISIILFLILGSILNNIASNLLVLKINMFRFDIFHFGIILISLFIIIYIIFLIYHNKTKKISPMTMFKEE